jgi:uncharacterized protein (DUF488 family)
VTTERTPKADLQPAGTIWTIGHSTRTLEAFVAVLHAHGIEAIADVRRFPGSRRLPQFNEPALADGLERAGIAYRSLTSLGGRRRPQPDSVNTGWRHEAFRGYADHLASEEFADGLVELLMIAGGLRTAVMCAEMLWWQCHRRLIADVLTSLGADVLHIQTEKPAEQHQLAAPARLVDGVLSYEAPQPSLFDHR